MPERIMLHVLGGTRVTPDLPLTAAQRAVLAAIGLRHPHPVGVEDLADFVWPGGPPASARAALQNQISKLRAVLPVPALETTTDGYRWKGRIDTARLRDAVVRAEGHLEEGVPERAFTLADRILKDMTGEAFQDLPLSEPVNAFRVQVELHRYALENIRLSAALAKPRSEWSVIEAERLARAAPFDETRHALLAKALASLGRRSEALSVVASFRRRLRDELGISATEIITRTEQEILLAGQERPRKVGVGEVVGREQELAFVVEQITDGKNVVVSGEAGVGVSAFLTMLATDMPRDRWKTVLIRHDISLDSEPLTTLKEILTLLDVPPVPAWTLLSRFTALVDSARRGKPLLILIDDAETLGPSTMQALKDASQIPEITVVLGTHQTLPTWQEAALVLGGLSDESIRRIATAYGRTTVTTQQATQLQEITGGNPLLLHAVIESGDRIESEATGSSLAPIIRSRLSDLSPTARDAVDWAAVSAGSIPAELLHQEVPGLLSVCDEDPVFLREQDLCFRHDAVRQIVYSDIPDPRRAELHHTLARIATTHALDAHVVAEHSLGAAQIDPSGVVSAVMRAAEESARVGAHEDAAAVLEQGVEILPVQFPERLHVQIARGDALRLAGNPAHLGILHDAAEAALAQGDYEALAKAMFALLQLGATSVVGQIDDRTLELTRTALETLRTPEHRALVSGAASLSLSMSGQAEQALDSFRRAEQLAVTRSTRDAVLPFAYLALGHPDQREERHRSTQELIESGRRNGVPQALWEGLHQLFSQHSLDGDHASMRTVHEEMTSLMPRLGDAGRSWSLRYQEAALAHLGGDDDLAEQLATDAYRLFAPVSEARAAAALQGQVLGIRLTQNRTHELADDLRKMVAGQPSVPAWHAALAHATAHTRPEESRHHLELALERAHKDFTWLATHVVGARASYHLKDRALAGRFLDELAPYSDLACWQGTCNYGPVATALGMVAELCGDERAAQFAEQAIVIAEKLEAPHFISEAQLL